MKAGSIPAATRPQKLAWLQTQPWQAVPVGFVLARADWRDCPALVTLVEAALTSGLWRHREKGMLANSILGLIAKLRKDGRTS